jgi:hypothetical protein
VPEGRCTEFVLGESLPSHSNTSFDDDSRLPDQEPDQQEGHDENWRQQEKGESGSDEVDRTFRGSAYGRMPRITRKAISRIGAIDR